MSEVKSRKVEVFIYCFVVSFFFLVTFSHAADKHFFSIIEKIPLGVLRYWYFFLVGISMSLIVNMKFYKKFSKIPTKKLFFLEISGVIVASLCASILYTGLKMNVLAHTAPIAIAYCFIIEFIISFVAVKVREARR